MKLHLYLSALGTCLFFICTNALDDRSDLNAQTRTTEGRQSRPFLTRPHGADNAKYSKRDISRLQSTEWNSSVPKLRKRGGRRWSGDEEELLLKLRRENKPWDEILEQFPDRTYISLTGKYFQLTKDPSKPKQEAPEPWTPEEEELLFDLLDAGLSWEEMAEYFTGRSAAAVNNHYHQMTLPDDHVPSTSRKSWTTDEDKRLLKLAKGKMTWEEITKYFENRSAMALLHRYQRLKPKAQKRGSWTTAEDKLLAEAVKKGRTPDQITKIIARSEKAIERRMKRLKKAGRYGLEPPERARYSFTDAQLELIYNLREQGMSWRRIYLEHFPDRSLSGIRKAGKRYQEEREKP